MLGQSIPTVQQQFVSSGVGYAIEVGLPAHGGLTRVLPSLTLSAICPPRWLATQSASAAGQTQQNL